MSDLHDTSVHPLDSEVEDHLVLTFSSDHDEFVELRQLTYFEAVARLGGFTRAAEQLRIAQPAVSAQIRRLESELGTALLERTTRSVALTAAGQAFLARVQRVLRELDEARGELEELASVVRGRVRLGAPQMTGTVDVPAALARFRTEHPGVTLALRSGLVAELIAQLQAGELDLVLSSAPADPSPSVVVRSLATERLVLIAPTGHRLATRRRVRLSDACDEAWVSLRPGSGLHTILRDSCESEGFTPRIDFETYNAVSVRELVAAGLGVALVAASVVEAPGAPVAVCRLASPPPHPSIALMRMRDRRLTPAARALSQELVRSAHPG